MNNGLEASTLQLQPIGHVRTDAVSRVQAPHQPSAAQGRIGRIELVAGRHLDHAIEDLEGCDRIWVIFWFHLNASWRPKVLPPRGPGKRRGVLATRSPHRPNPLGLSVLRLIGVEGLVLTVSDVDMVDGTPVLDIKPYVAYTDAHADAGVGWLAQQTNDRQGLDPLQVYRVSLSELAAAQLAWIDDHAAEPLSPQLLALLAADPRPRPYRRIRREGEGFRIALHDWRASFTVDGQQVSVVRIGSGYRASQLSAGQATSDKQLDLHREFQSRWPP